MGTFTPKKDFMDAMAKDWIVANLPSRKEREEIRQSYKFQKWTTVWRAGYYSARWRVGAVMEAADWLTVDSTPAEWVEIYTNNCKKYSEIIVLLTEISVKEKISLEKALVAWWIHIIDSFYEGRISELKILEACNQKITQTHNGITLKQATQFEDLEYGVDIVGVDSEGNIKFGIQTKPNTYFTGNRQHIIKHRDFDNPKKYAKFFQETGGARVWYAVIEEVLSGKDWQLKKAYHAGIDNPADFDYLSK